MSITRHSSSVLPLILLVGIVFRPHPGLLGAAGAVYLGDALLVTGLVAWLVFAGAPARAATERVLVLLVLLLVSGVLVLWTVTRPAIMIEALKIVYYAAIALFFVFAAERTWSPERTRSMLAWTLLLLVVIAALQFIDFGPLGTLVKLVWGENKLRTIILGFNARVYSSYYNANWFAFGIGMIGVVLFADYVRLGRSRMAAGVVLLTLLGIVLSGSRSGFVAFAAGMLTAFAVRFAQGEGATRLRLSMLALVSTASLVVIVWQFAERFRVLGYIGYLLGVYEDHDLGSQSERLVTWGEAVQAIIANPLGVGSGPIVLAHNSYLTALLYFGVAGVLLIAFVPISVALVSRTTRGLLLVLPAAAVFFAGSMTAELFFTTQVMLTLLLLAFASDLLTRSEAVDLGPMPPAVTTTPA